jgi:IS30 family transposase
LEREEIRREMGMKYRQLNGEERSVLAALRLVGLKPAEIARELGRHRSTVSRELKRNAAPYDGCYRARRAQQRAPTRGVIGRGATASLDPSIGSEWKGC